MEMEMSYMIIALQVILVYPFVKIVHLRFAYLNICTFYLKRLKTEWNENWGVGGGIADKE